MPRGDKTGPKGYGPRSGRGLGYCNGYDSPGYTKNLPSSGHGIRQGRERIYGRGFGCGRGFGYHGINYPKYHTNYPSEPEHSINKDEEKNYLKQAINHLESELSSLQDWLKNLEKTKKNPHKI